MRNNRAVDKLVSLKKSRSSQLDEGTNKPNSSPKTYSISAMALEVGAQFKERFGNNSISAIAPELEKQYKLEQETRLRDLRNQFESGLHKQISLMHLVDEKLFKSGREGIRAKYEDLLATNSIASVIDEAKALLEKNSLTSKIKESIDWLRAGDLFDAITENDHVKVAEIIASYNPVFPLLKNLVAWSSMSQESLIAVLNENKAAIETELDNFHQKNKERIKKATETRIATSKKNEINAWFLKKKNAKINLNNSDITSEAAQVFGVTPQYINKLKSAFLSAKTK